MDIKEMVIFINISTGTGYDSFTTNDIIGLAVDMENLKIYWHKNGTYQNSKDPASNVGETNKQLQVDS